MYVLLFLWFVWIGVCRARLKALLICTMSPTVSHTHNLNLNNTLQNKYLSNAQWHAISKKIKKKSSEKSRDFPTTGWAIQSSAFPSLRNRRSLQVAVIPLFYTLLLSRCSSSGLESTTWLCWNLDKCVPSRPPFCICTYHSSGTRCS